MKNEKKKVIFIRSNPINPDSRVENEIDYLIGNYDIEALGWDRRGENKKIEKRKNFTIFRHRGRGNYGSGLKNIIPLLKWWVYEFIWLMDRDFDFIHACDFDTYLPALLIVKIKRKKIIYDIFDFYAYLVAATVPLFFRKIIKKIDLFLIKFADGVIITDEGRLRQIYRSNPKKIISLYNTPPDLYESFKQDTKDIPKNKKFVVGYMGLIEKNRGLDSIINIVSKRNNRDELELIIGGEGPYKAEMIEKIKVQNIRNIKIIGRIPYKDSLKMLSKCDAMFALYDPRMPNYKYSSPNKLFEAMMFGRPIIVSRNTSMDKIVERYKCGIVIDYGNEERLQEAISELINLKKNGENPYGKAGRKIYLTVFHPNIMQERLIQFYKSIDSKE